MGKVFFSSWNGNLFDSRDCGKDELSGIQELGLPDIFSPDEKIKAIVGWNGLVLVDGAINIVEILRAYFESVQKESCGRCVPCRIGTRVILEKLVSITEGKGSEEDLNLLEKIACLVRDTSLCELGGSSPVPLLQSLKYFKSEYLKLIGSGERACRGDNNYRQVFAVPCINACPAHMDILNYVGCAKEGKFEESFAIIREKTPFVGVLGRVCVKFCEDKCRRRNVEGAISIRAIKRFVADFERDFKGSIPVACGSVAGDKEESKKHKVAVIGSGPAGLTAAYQLIRSGYKVTVFEALGVAGGMLAAGIPDYRLPREILQREIELVKDLGVEIKLNARVGKDLLFEDIEKNFDAVYVATGLHESAKMRVEGEDAGYGGFTPGVDYLRKMNLGLPVELGERVAVIGGGNVAMDCARSALRLGVKEVNLIYRRSRAEMPANEHEVKDAEAEGVQFHLLANPTRLIVEDERVVALECIRMKLGEPDSSGRRRPIPVEGSEFVLPMDTVIPAIGQAGDFSWLPTERVEITKRGNIKVDPVTLMTGAPGIFSGGDAAFGARTVIEAVADANRAARSIDRFLRGEELVAAEDEHQQAVADKLGAYDPTEAVGIVGGLVREEEDILPVSERLKGFEEVELGLKHLKVTEEADRCLQCRRLALVVT